MIYHQWLNGYRLSSGRNAIDALPEGGQIDAESELGKGTSFVVRLPVWNEAKNDG